MSQLLNHFCQLKKTRPKFDYAQIENPGQPNPKWRCAITVPGVPITSQAIAANKKLAGEASAKDYVEQLQKSGLLRGLPMPQALTQSTHGGTRPSWAISGGKEDSAAKRFKAGGGPLSASDQTDKVVDRILSTLKIGKVEEALGMVRSLQTSPRSITVKKFVGIVAAISLRTPVQAVLRLFDTVEVSGLIAFPLQMGAGTSYFLRFSRWAVREFLAEGQQAVERARTVQPHILEKQGVCCQRMTANGSKGGSEFTLTADNVLPSGHCFLRGDWLIITVPHTGQVKMPGTQGDSMTFEAELVGFHPGGPGPQAGLVVKVVASSSKEVGNLDGRLCRVDRSSNRVNFSRQMEALRVLCGEPGGLAWLSEILMAAEQKGGEGIAVARCNAKPPSAGLIQAGSIKDRANNSQLEALAAATSRRVTLIQGPPGCGKTNTSIMLMQILIESGRRPVLACAESNIAVDNLVQGCAKVGLKVVRLGRQEASKVDLKQYSVTEQAKALSPGTTEAKNLWGLERRILAGADVVCCTCSGAASGVMEDMTFACVLIDEAGQATELTTLVPFLSLRSDGFVVLIGDHKQLPATIACQEAADEGLANSLFERLVAQGVPPVSLDTQYRMHPAIAAFPSRQYYQGWLKSGVSGESRPSPKGVAWPVPQAPVAFLHVDGKEATDGSSYSNMAEVRTIADILRNVLRAGDIKGSDVGVITPYAAQARVLRQHLGVPSGSARFSSTAEASAAAGFPEVSSVDGFQGREKELILMSPVRANAYGRVGFTADPRRLNVSFTRARRGLLVCGHYPTLSQDMQGWKPWLDWAEDRGLVIGQPARDRQAARELVILDSLTKEQLLQHHERMRNRSLVCVLRVQEGAGAGLDLLPESGGMRVLQVDKVPGQPDLRKGDLICAIEGVTLEGDIMEVGNIFGSQFRDGAKLSVLRAM